MSKSQNLGDIVYIIKEYGFEFSDEEVQEILTKVEKLRDKIIEKWEKQNVQK